MRLLIDVLPRQPCTCAQPVMPDLTPMPEHVVRDLVLELVDEGRPLRARTDDRHLALEHVPDLRQLVERGAAKEGADASSSRVVAHRPDRTGARLCVDAHRAELQNHELAPVQPHAHLTIEDRAAILEPDQQCNDGQEGQQHDHRHGGDRQVHGALGQGVPALERHLRQIDDRDAVDVFEGGPQRGVLEEIGNQTDLDALAVDLVE